MPEVNFGDSAVTAAEVEAQAVEDAKVEAAKAELVDEAQQDDGLILGKYETQDDLIAGYQNLQRELSRLKNGEGDPAPTEPEPTPAAEQSEPEPEAPADQGGIDAERAAAIRGKVLEQAGGEAEYKRLANWAANNLSADRTNAFNDALAKGDEVSILNALKSMQYDYMMKNGYEPKLTGGRAVASDAEGFKSRFQITQAMSDPRYQHDAAYRKDVERRIAASSDSLFEVTG